LKKLAWIWRLEVDDHLSRRRAWRTIDAEATDSPEYIAKKQFMVRFVELLREMGAGELSRQYYWWTLKSQPNCLRRDGAGPHPALDALLFLRRSTAKPLHELTCVRIRVHPLLPRMMTHDRPRSSMEARFSIRYCLAAALADGVLTLGSFDSKNLRRRDIQGWMDRIELQPDLGKEGRKGEIPTRSEVQFHWKDGKTSRKCVSKPLGNPENPLPEQALEEKFRDCARRTLPAKRVEKIILLFRNIKDTNNLRELTGKLAG